MLLRILERRGRSSTVSGGAFRVGGSIRSSMSAPPGQAPGGAETPAPAAHRADPARPPAAPEGRTALRLVRAVRCAARPDVPAEARTRRTRHIPRIGAERTREHISRNLFHASADAPRPQAARAAAAGHSASRSYPIEGVLPALPASPSCRPRRAHVSSPVPPRGCLAPGPRADRSRGPDSRCGRACRPATSEYSSSDNRPARPRASSCGPARTATPRDFRSGKTMNQRGCGQMAVRAATSPPPIGGRVQPTRSRNAPTGRVNPVARQPGRFGRPLPQPVVKPRVAPRAARRPPGKA